jgi:penicillin-binding protein 2
MARQLSEMRNWQQETSLTHHRVMVIGTLMLIVLIALLYRYFSLQVIHHEKYRVQSESNRIGFRLITPTRGVIEDRLGNLVAVNEPSFTLTVSPEGIEDLDRTLETVGQIIDLSESELEVFRTALKRRRPLSDVPLKYRLDDKERAVLAVNKHRLPGLKIKSALSRYYPYGDLLGHVVGYVGRIGVDDIAPDDEGDYRGLTHIGKIGLEAQYESVLKGRAGRSRVETDARGAELGVIDRELALPGERLELHLDVGLQAVAAKALGDRRGAVVALDATNGGVLAALSNPRYEPNKFVNGISNTDYSLLRDSRDAPLINRVIQGQYPPASTIKPMLGLAGLNLGLIDANTEVKDPGFYMLAGDDRRYRDWILRVRGTGHAPTMKLQESIAQSCDVYFYDLANRMGIDPMAEALKSFGLGAKTGIDLPSEKAGLIPSSDWKREALGESWYGGETLIVGIGQGYSLSTPMQLAAATTVVANRGVAYRPRVVRAVNNEPIAPEILTEVDAPGGHWQTVIDGMVDTVDHVRGTAHGMKRGLSYSVASKTGTSQVVEIAQDAVYNEEELSEYQRNHGWFTAFAPVENPKIVVVVLVENGGGGSAAFPVARQVMDYWFAQNE